MNYQIILSGVRRAQSFLEVESLTPQEALGVANLALDILMLFKLDAHQVPPHIRKCLIDYVAFFLSEDAEYDYIVNAVLQKHSQPVAASAILTDDITEKEISRMFKYSILYGFEHDLPVKNDMINTLMYALNKCNYELSILRLYYIENAINNGFIELSEFEENAITQAKRHINVISKSLNNDKWVWWLMASGFLKEIDA